MTWDALLRRFEKPLLALWSVVLFAVSFTLNTRHNDFPYYYHPDEPGKTEQIIEKRWNFNHPMLLLSSTKLWMAATGVGEDKQAIVKAGRTVNAVFTSVAIVALSLLAYAWVGWPGAILAGGALAVHHQLYELSHYMKEDPALLMGIAVTLLASQLFAWKRSLPRAAMLGAACALAVSGKYLGVITLPFAVWILWRSPAESRNRLLASFGVALALALFAVNFPMLSSPEVFQKSFSRELSLAREGQGGMTRRVPHTVYWNVFLDNATPVIWILLAIFLVQRWRERRDLLAIQWVALLVPLVYTILLSFSPKTNDRYFLPVTAILTTFAALGVEDLARMLSDRFPRRLVRIIAGVLLVGGMFPAWTSTRPGWLRYDRAFQRDDNADLIEFLNTSVPPDAVLVKDNRIALPDPKRKKHADRVGIIPQRVIAKRYAADAGTLEELRKMGVTHVIVSESDYGKFFLSSLSPQDSGREEYERRRDFYEELFNEADLKWERERSAVIYLHPGIRVYDITGE